MRRNVRPSVYPSSLRGLTRIRGFAASVDLFAKVLDDTLTNAHLALTLCVRRALAATPFGLEYPPAYAQSDPEHVCAVKASMVVRAVARLMRCAPRHLLVLLLTRMRA